MKTRDNFIEGQKIKETNAGRRASGRGSWRINQWIKKRFAPNCNYHAPGFVFEGPIDRWVTDGGRVEEDFDPLDDYCVVDTETTLLVTWRSTAYKWIKKQFAPHLAPWDNMDQWSRLWIEARLRRVMERHGLELRKPTAEQKNDDWP
jgi:hypothetical protein